MRKHARSESRRVVRDVGNREAEKIGSRVLPLRGSPSPPMPSLGTRRSTRAFVRKNVPKVPQDGDARGTRVLRSGKRLTVSKPVGGKPSGHVGVGDYGWAGFFGGSGDMEETSWRKGRQGAKQGQMVESRRRPKEGLKLGVEMPKKTVDETSKGASLRGRAFGIVYSRKRRRSSSDGFDSFYSQLDLEDSKGNSISPSNGLSSSSSFSGDGGGEDRRFGIAFIRKPRSKKPKLSSLVARKAGRTEFSGKGLEITESARSFAQKVGILERYLWLGSMDQVVLVALVHSACDTGLRHFACLFVSILNGMMKKKISLPECAAFVSSRSAGDSVSFRGVHFLPVRHWRSDFSHRIAMTGAGFCIIFGARLVSVNFAALPSLFKTWHLSIVFSSLYLPTVLARYQRQWCKFADEEVNAEAHKFYDSDIYAEASASEMEIEPFGTSTTEEIDVVGYSQISLAKEISDIAGASDLIVQNSSTITGMKLRKRPRKRGILRSSRVSRRSLLKSRGSSLLDLQNGMLKVDTRVKVHPIHEGCEFKPIDEKPHGSYLEEDSTEQHVLPSPTSPNLKRRRSVIKSSLPRIKEPKPAFSERKQSIDVLTCTANILVTESDRCWREEGAKIMLELSRSNEWCLAVKFGDSTRFLHKAQEMKPSSSNRYTHAMTWTCDNGWKLEFSDKNDWNIFKEMHKECCERNVPEIPVRVIPVPGVIEVSGYEENLASSFMRPDSYIHMVNDEVDRALLSENVCYDMDSGDEDWLKQLNSRALSADPNCPAQISGDNFEKTISAFEKAAYSHPDNVSDQEKAAILCSQFADRYMVASIFDYWNKKRKQKHSALVRVFQGQPPRKRQLVQKPLLRKRRSFKRQGSHVGRGKPDVFFEAAATQGAVLKLQAAEAAASRAIDIAIQLRSRAQVLMLNADLAMYKSVMALRLAEAVQESESLDLPSSLLG